MLLAGEDIGKLGGVFRVTEGLQKDFGEHRVIDSPLAESGIVGTAVGLAMRGYRPVCEIQFDGFVYPAFDQIVSQVAKFHNRSAGRQKMPIVIRIPSGGGIGAVEHHSESPETYFAHTPGLKVVTCSNPVDAYWMIQQAVASDDPVIFFEPKRRYHEKAELDTSIPPIPLHSARIVRPGTDVTVLCYGPMVKTCLDAAGAAAEEGRSLEVIDLRTLSPIDMATVVTSVRKTGHAVVVHEARDQPGPGGRALRSDHRAVLLLVGGARAAGGRVRHPLSAEPGRGRVPAGPGPSARRRRPVPGLLARATDSRRGEQRVAIKEFRLPDPGEGLVEADIVTWRVAVGDEIKINDILVEIETSKSLVELPSPFHGTVTGLLVSEGDTVDVGVPIIAIDDGSEVQETAPAAAPAVPASPGGADENGERVANLVGYGAKPGDTRRRPRKNAAGETAAGRGARTGEQHLRHRRTGVAPG